MFFFLQTLIYVDLRQADPFLQFFADNPKMQNCMESIFGLVMNGGTPPAGPSFSSRLRMGDPGGEILQSLAPKRAVTVEVIFGDVMVF